MKVVRGINFPSGSAFDLVYARFGPWKIAKTENIDIPLARIFACKTSVALVSAVITLTYPNYLDGRFAIIESLEIDAVEESCILALIRRTGILPRFALRHNGHWLDYS